MISRGSALAARLLKYMCGLEPPTERLLNSYRTALHDNTIELPDRLDVDYV